MRKHIGFELSKSNKLTKIAPEPELREYFKSLTSKKNHLDYIQEFLIDEELFTATHDNFDEQMKNSLPADVKENCLYCDELNPNEDKEKNCDRFYTQMNITFTIASTEFIKIVRKNKNIYENKNDLQELTKCFYNCFHFINGKGLVYFDVGQLIKYTLNINFKVLSKLFEDSEILESLSNINNTINHLNDKETHNELFEIEDDNFISIQKKYFEGKRDYLKEKIAIAEKTGTAADVKKIMRNSTVRPNRTDLAFFIYYLEATRTKIIESVFPSDKAWKEIGGKFDRSPKNIQKVYNLILNEKERLKKRRDDNLQYVIENMLANYDKALKLAKDELKLAKLNS